MMMVLIIIMILIIFFLTIFLTIVLIVLIFLVKRSLEYLEPGQNRLYPALLGCEVNCQGLSVAGVVVPPPNAPVLTSSSPRLLLLPL